MATVMEEYPQLIEHVIDRHSDYSRLAADEFEVQKIFDREHNHYQLAIVGWRGNRRLRGCVIHVDIKDGKIWIQHDGTESGVANDLMELGVPKEKIVLAYHAPYTRQHTGFAVN